MASGSVVLAGTAAHASMLVGQVWPESSLAALIGLSKQFLIGTFEKLSFSAHSLNFMNNNFVHSTFILASRSKDMCQTVHVSAAVLSKISIHNCLNYFLKKHSLF